MKKQTSMIKTLKDDFQNITISKIISLSTFFLAFFSYIIANLTLLIEKGYTEAFGISNITFSLPFSSIFLYLILPIIFTLISVLIIITQKKDNIGSGINIYIAKFLCFFQIIFFFIFLYVLYIITDNSSLVSQIPLCLLCIVDSIIFFILYFKFEKHKILTFLNSWYGIILFVSTLSLFYFFILYFTFNDDSFSKMLTVFAIISSSLAVIPLYIMDELKIIKKISKNKKNRKKIKKKFYKIDSPFKCFCFFSIIIFLVFLFNPMNFKKYGRNLASSEICYSTTDSSINFKLHQNIDGFLIFKTKDNKNIAIGYKIYKKKSKEQNYTSINILKGYKYINLNNIEILEQKFKVNIQK